MTDLKYIDHLACPECGALAERIGHEYEARGGDETGFEQDTIFITRSEHGGRWRGNEPGVVAIDNASAFTSRTGATVKTSSTVYALAVTHLCPRCLVVFPAQWCRPWRDTTERREGRP